MARGDLEVHGTSNLESESVLNGNKIEIGLARVTRSWLRA